MDPDSPVDPQTVVQRASVMLQTQGLLVSAVPKSDKLVDDYNPEWMLGAHPSTFPHNKGGCPPGMSEERWAQCLLQRYPARQYARNLGMIADCFNVIQRHSVNKNAWIQFQFRPDQQAAVTSLSQRDVQAVLDLISSNAFGANLTNGLNALPPGARILYNGVKAVGGRVLGTPQSFMSLRSKVMAGTSVFGAYTCHVNLNPSETSAKWTFELAGEKYEHDIEGYPSTRPHIVDCKRIIAANPVACADFLMAYLRGFVEVFCGWPMDSDHQVNPDCLFGLIRLMYLKYESSQRRGLHAHGQLCQPVLQHERLKQIMMDGTLLEHLFNYFENIMCAYFPVPEYPMAPPAAQEGMCKPTCPPHKSGKLSSYNNWS